MAGANHAQPVTAPVLFKHIFGSTANLFPENKGKITRHLKLRDPLDEVTSVICWFVPTADIAQSMIVTSNRFDNFMTGASNNQAKRAARVP